MDARDKLLGDLADREAIRECLYLYCRGIDRQDSELIKSAYWPDADAQQLDFRGGPDALVEWALPQMRKMDINTHHLGIPWIRLEGDSAKVETTYISYRRMQIDGKPADFLGCGRYLDVFERRASEWRIAKRLVVPDWSRTLSDPAGPESNGPELAKRYPDDVSYSWFE